MNDMCGIEGCMQFCVSDHWGLLMDVLVLTQGVALHPRSSKSPHVVVEPNVR